MEILKMLFEVVSSKKITHVILNILGILLIGVLFMANQPIWSSAVDTIWLLAKPFLIGFILAFVLNPFVNYMQRYIKNRSLSIILIFFLAIGLISLLAWLIIPLLYSSINEMIPSFSKGLKEIQVFLIDNFKYDISSLTKHIQNLADDLLKDTVVLDTTIDVLNQVLTNISNFMIYIILGIYMSYNYRDIRRNFGRLAVKFDKNLPKYLLAIDRSLIQYIRAFVIGALAQGIMTCIMYLAIGHDNWLVLGLLSGISCIFPYVGPIAVNCLGLITSLFMGPTYIIILIILIFIQSTVMGYVVTPKIYSTQIDLSIMWVLFGLLSGSALFGVWGMVIAIPILVSIKVVYKVYQDYHPRTT